MGAYSWRFYFEDIWQQLRCNKRRLFACIFCMLLGTVLGVVLVNVVNYDWWYCNRLEFAEKLLAGGFFAVFGAFFASAVLCSFCLWLFSLWHWTPVLCYALLVVISLYFGANCAAIFICLGVVGLLYVLFVLLVGLLIDALCCFLTLSLPNCRRTVREAAEAQCVVFIWQLAGVILKIIVIFLFIRLLAGTI